MTSSEILVFRYVDKADVKEFERAMSEKGLAFSPAGAGDDRSAGWDYPKIAANRLEPVSFRERMGGSAEFQGLELREVRSFTISSPPDHFPFVYTMIYLFALPTGEADPTREAMVEFTGRAKKLTDRIHEPTPTSYRPVYWFLPANVPGEAGLIGSLRRTGSKDKPDSSIERAFPYASYAVHGAERGANSFDLDNLAMVSVIAHMVERRHREELRTAVDHIVAAGKMADEVRAVGSVEEINKGLSKLADAQALASAQLQSLYHTRRLLTRSRGLVARVQELRGSDKERPNLFDLVCSDAIVAVEDEANVSLSEIQTRLADISSRLRVSVERLTAERTSAVQRWAAHIAAAALVLQLAAVAVAVATVADKILYPGLLSDKCRAGVILLLVLASLVAGLIWIKPVPKEPAAV